MTDKEKKEIELILGCVFLQIKDGPLDSVWDVYDEFEKQFKHFIDSLQEEPVSDRFAFKAIPRLLDMIEPTDKAKSYVTKLADAFDSEGYYTDAKIVRESLKIMNGEKVPMATMDEEPVSDELEEAAKSHAVERYKATRDMVLAEKCKWSFKAGAEWQKQQDQETIELAEDHAMLAGMEKMREQMMKNIWKPADGNDLPDIDREVIVLTQKYPLKGSEYAVSFAHRPYKGKYIGKSLTTGNIETFENQTYDKGEWNIPDVKYWLNAELPKEIKL